MPSGEKIGRCGNLGSGVVNGESTTKELSSTSGTVVDSISKDVASFSRTPGLAPVSSGRVGCSRLWHSSFSIPQEPLSLQWSLRSLVLFFFPESPPSQ